MNSRFCPECRRTFGRVERCPTHGIQLTAMPGDFPDAGTDLDGLYELEAPIAQGGMSRIYRARHLPTSRLVAIKVLDPHLAAESHTVERFLREARVSALLDHPNVLRIHGFGLTAGGNYAIAMELLGGENLGAILNRRGPLPWERAVHVTIELCDALGHAHSRLVVHRDVKPENIQLIGDPGADEKVKLLDFGVAYVAADKAFSEPAPGSTRVSGTPAYMSPEQIRGSPLDGRSDVYALGVVLFEMLTGRRPFEGLDPVEVCRHHLYDRPPSLAERLPEGVEAPKALHVLVREALAKSRKSRVSSVGAFLARMMEILPQHQWPRRFRRRMADASLLRDPRQALGADVVKRAGAVRPVAGGAAPSRARIQRIVVLHTEVSRADGKSFSSRGLPRRLARVLWGWRSIVERSGGVIVQPEAHVAKVLLGLYGPAERLERWVGDAVRHATSLAGLIEELASEGEGDERLLLVTRAGISTDSRQVPDVGSHMGLGAGALLGGSHADMAFRVCRLGRAGDIVLDATTQDLARALGELHPLGPVRIRGTDQEFAASRLVPHAVAPGTLDALEREAGLEPLHGVPLSEPPVEAGPSGVPGMRMSTQTVTEVDLEPLREALGEAPTH